MDIDILEKHDNILLERTEVKVRVKHTKEPTPSRKDLTSALKDTLGLKNEVIVVDSLVNRFGRDETELMVRVYRTTEKARSVEGDHILKRNGLWEEPKKKGGK
ncbi:MAG: 30S ribosomal protein S24e [Candidatus Thermoplasmatota archaeon]|nr:30S ribosomal protein S24e [Candidatus Thermoplasmatota archaeon]